VKVAVVGCGAAAEFFHLPALVRVVGRDKIWLVDRDEERARSLARRFGRREHVFVDHREIAVDAAIVAVPNDQHEPVAVDLLRRGIRVLCEKPLARSAPEARRIVEAAAGEDALGVGLFRRLLPESESVAAALRSASPRRFHVVSGTSYAWSPVSAYMLERERAGGGVTIDLGPHLLDLLRFWLGELELVAYRDDAHGGVEADAVVELRAGGVAGTVELSRTRALGESIEIECDHGVVAAPAPVAYAHALERQLTLFLDGRPAATGADGLRLAEFVDECYARREPLAEPWTTETLVRG
jgi:predicted dehydrogenase